MEVTLASQAEATFHYATMQRIREPEVRRMLQVTGISDSEEEAMGRADLVPFLLEDRIREVRPALRALSHSSRM